MNNHNHYCLYSTSIYDYITSNGRISKKLFEKIVIPQLDSAFKMHQDNNKLIKEIDSLKKQLDEAVKVIEFYADKKNWKDMDLLGYEPCIKTDSEMGGYGSTMPEETDHLTVGGKRAREFLQKMKEKK